jgi:LysM repeat protein
MISNRYTEIGVGYATGHDQNFYVMVVGNPSGGPPATTGNNGGNNTQPEAVAMVAPIVLALPGEDGSIVHRVGPGQTIWAIAARYEVPLADIYLFNSLAEDAVLQPGQELTIRLAEGQPPPPTPTPPAAHRVREGDTLWTIALWNKVELADLLWLNQLPEDAVLQPGQEIILRLLPGQAPPPTATPQLAHVVKSGETLWTVAAVHGLTLDQLLSYNPGLTADSMVHIGDEIRIVPEMPTPLPTTAVSATVTMTPEIVVEAAAVRVQPAALADAFTPTAESPPPASQPTPIPTTAVQTNSLGSTLFKGTLWLGLGLVVVAVVAVLVVRETEW